MGWFWLSLSAWLLNWQVLNCAPIWAKSMDVLGEEIDDSLMMGLRDMFISFILHAHVLSLTNYLYLWTLSALCLCIFSEFNFWSSSFFCWICQEFCSWYRRWRLISALQEKIYDLYMCLQHSHSTSANVVRIEGNTDTSPSAPQTSFKPSKHRFGASGQHISWTATLNLRKFWLDARLLWSHVLGWGIDLISVWGDNYLANCTLPLPSLSNHPSISMQPRLCQLEKLETSLQFWASCQPWQGEWGFKPITI